MMKGASHFLEQPLLCLILISLLYLILLLPTVGRLGIHWDEQTDMDIALSYLDQAGGWLRGSDLDTTQTRLPMFLGAIVFSVMNRSSLLMARFMSCAIGVLTLMGVYTFCRREFNRKTGLLACLILATSPYFLSFSRIAFTESDIFITCATVWSLVCVSILRERRTVGFATATAIVLGIALSSKITGLLIYPVVLIVLTLSSGDTRESQHTYMSRANVFLGAAVLGFMFVVIGAVVGILYFGVGAYDPRFSRARLYVIVLVGWACLLGWLILHRKFVLRPFALSFFVLGFSSLTFLLIPPVHTTNPNVLKGLFGRFLFETMKREFLPINEVAGLLVGSVFLKSSVIIGGVLCLSVVMALLQYRRRRAVRLPLLTFGFYFLFLFLLAAAQTFYMMPIYPLLAILAADQWLRVYRRKRAIALGIVCLGALALGVDMFLCYPDYNLNGFQWLGARYVAGRASVGSRSIVQVASDGVEQALEWAKEEVPAGKTVITFIRPDHIVEAVCRGSELELIDGLRDARASTLEAEYVITSLNAEIRPRLERGEHRTSIYEYPYDLSLLRRNFSKVFAVRRSFDIEVASVWRRKGEAGDLPLHPFHLDSDG